MRLGAQLLTSFDSPEAWIRLLRERGYRAAYCPVTVDTPDALIEEYRLAAREADITIAEVGAWGVNPLSADPVERERSIAFCISRLELAEKVRASCCVSLTGTRNLLRWYGPHPDNASEETYRLIVRTFQRILDAVDPKQTFYTLEDMQWLPPDSAESYERLLREIDRPGLAVHYDPVNLVNSPWTYYHNAERMQDFVARLGKRIRSVHLKDTMLEDALTVRLSEVVPGRGNLDYHALLKALDPLGPDLPLMVEHLNKQEEIDEAVAFVRQTAGRLGITV
jgi:sugar phosphate isomerase/epimerase